jgi:opacity protein-like surface antigen
MKKIVIALIASAAAMGAAQAQDTSNIAPRAYLGAGIASADHRFELPGTSNVDSDGFKASGKVFGGYEIDKMWGVEAGYTDFRKSHASYTRNGVSGRADSDGHAYYVAGKATMPVNEQVSVYGKLGVSHTQADLSASDPVLNRSVSDTGVYAGVGLQYNVNQQVALIAEYERYGKQKDFGAKPDVFTVGAKYSF